MKNVTITLPEAIATQARVAAAGQGKSLSKFVAELIEREVGRDATTQLDAVEEFLSGPGYPGLSSNWRGREELYAEREDQLLRRYQSSRVRRRSRGADEASAYGGLAEAADPKPRAGPKSAKSK